ncbi:MAG: hypothetical protein KGZ49_11275 [Syntrophaceae bacterium]|nr:hypothetical protein [Syntrophaceae bacterium]
MEVNKFQIFLTSSLKKLSHPPFYNPSLRKQKERTGGRTLSLSFVPDFISKKLMEITLLLPNPA